MTRRRNSKVFLTGALITSASLLAAWAANRDVDVLRDAAPMDAVLEESSSHETVVSWDLPVTYNEHVEDWIDFLQGRNRSRTELWLERSGRYTPMIRAELRERGMPEDLIYLAFIESGYSTKAHSRAAAVGLWQFIAETGKRYGLEVSSYVDERRDPIKATDAALDYLQQLYDRFGSWYLAAAAYNTGENRVGRIMREVTGSERGDDADFWRIANRLPAETRNYVPLMLAAGHIGKDPSKYGFDDVGYHEPLAFATVRVPASTPLAAVAKAVGVSDEDISDLNPQLVKEVTPPKREWDVRVPVGSEQQFAANFPEALRSVTLVAKKTESARTSKASKADSRYHRVRRGENLSVIAAHYDTTVKKLKRLNALRGSMIRPGQRLRVS